MILDKLRNKFNMYPNAKIALFVRHGEKMDDEFDKLSSAGVYGCINFGKNLDALNVRVKIYSSPESRCVKSAEIIAGFISNCVENITVTNKLGKPGVQIRDNELYNKLYRVTKCRIIYNQWKNGEHYDILFSPAELRMAAETFINSTCSKTGLTLYISQSGTVASIGYALDIRNYDVENGEWVEYLDGFMKVLQN